MTAKRLRSTSPGVAQRVNEGAQRPRSERCERPKMGLSGDGLKCGTRSFGHTCRMARYASRTRGTADGVGSGIASLVWLLAVVAASFLVLYIILVLFEANPNNDLVNFISDVANKLAWVFRDLFDVNDKKLEIVLNYGLAAVVYLAVGRVAARALRRV